MKYFTLLLMLGVFVTSQSDLYVLFGQSSRKQLSPPPQLPVNIPPPPNFGNVSSKNGRYQLISAEHYSQDAKPFLYKRLVKVDTVTGKSWVLQSVGGPGKEVRSWVPLVGDN